MVWYNKENPAKRVNEMNIGEKIKRIRQHRRMTQKELGELVDLSANRIAQYEMGYRVPKKPLLNQIAEALRVSFRWRKRPGKRYSGAAFLAGRGAARRYQAGAHRARHSTV